MAVFVRLHLLVGLQIVVPSSPPRRSRLLPLVLITLCVLVPLSLGIWQVKRAFWKADLLEALASSASSPPEQLLSVAALSSRHELKHGTLKGRWLTDQAILVGPRTLAGQNGFHLYVPFLLGDQETKQQAGTPKQPHLGKAGLPQASLWINCGWVHSRSALTEMPLANLCEVTVRVRKAQTPTFFTPPNIPARQEWYWADLSQMAASPSAHTLFYGELISKAPFSSEISALDPKLENRHIQYAITWFVLAFCIAIMGYRRSREGLKQRT